MRLNDRSLIGKLNDSARAALEGAPGLCLSRTHYDVEIEHYLMKLLDASDGDFACILKHFGVDKSRLAAELTRSLDKLKTGNARTPALSPTVLKMLTEGLDHRLHRFRRRPRCAPASPSWRWSTTKNWRGSMRDVSKEFQKDSAPTPAQGLPDHRGGLARRTPILAAAAAAGGAARAAPRPAAARRRTSISSPSTSPRTPSRARSIRCWAAISRSAR